MRYTVTITSMHPDGTGLCVIDGKTTHVPHSVTGDVLEIALTHRRRSSARAVIQKLLSPGPERVEPRCPHIAACGGCDWQHVDYAAQLRYKTAHVRQTLAAVAGAAHSTVRDCLPCPQPYAYRNRMQLAPELAINTCAIAEAAINARLAGLAGGDAVYETQLHGERDLRAANEVMRDGTLWMDVAGRRYRVSPSSFFQVNTCMAALLIDEVLCAVQPHTGMRVLELFSGAGLFSAPLCDAGAQVVALESDASAVADAQVNAPAARQIHADAGQSVLREEIQRARWDAVLVDPPRAGVAFATLKALAVIHPQRLVYVSCDLATLARDARILLRAGYRLEWTQPLDLFPQTAHVETVTRFAIA